MSRIITFAQPASPPVLDQPRPERREVGAPQRETWTLYEHAGDCLAAGIWACEPGRWRIEFGPHEHEYFIVLEGRARLHDEAGGFTEIGPGEAALFPAGFRGSFEVLERVSLIFELILQHTKKRFPCCSLQKIVGVSTSLSILLMGSLL